MLVNLEMPFPGAHKCFLNGILRFGLIPGHRV